MYKLMVIFLFLFYFTSKTKYNTLDNTSLSANYMFTFNYHLPFGVINFVYMIGILRENQSMLIENREENFVPVNDMYTHVPFNGE